MIKDINELTNALKNSTMLTPWNSKENFTLVGEYVCKNAELSHAKNYSDYMSYRNSCDHLIISQKDNNCKVITMDMYEELLGVSYRTEVQNRGKLLFN